MKSGNTLVVYYSRPDENYNVGTVEVGRLSNANVIGDGFNMTGMKARTEEGIRMLDEWTEKIKCDIIKV